MLPSRAQNGHRQTFARAEKLGLAAGYFASSMLFEYVIVRRPIIESRSLILLLALLLMVVLAFWKNERFHIVAVVLAYLLLIAWVAVTLFTL